MIAQWQHGNKPLCNKYSSLVPIIARTWAERGHVPILYESEKRTSETGIGFITLTPQRRILRFRFTMYSGSANTDDIIFDLNIVHRYYQKTALIVWDGLPAHGSAERYFLTKHPDWFEFHYLPSYSPELNPVEPCWNEMKNGPLSNFIADNIYCLREAAHAAADDLDKRSDIIVPTIFKHSRLRLGGQFFRSEHLSLSKNADAGLRLLLPQPFFNAKS